MAVRPANVPAREAVIALRKGTQQLYLSLGGVNWQIGRDYPLQQVMLPESWTCSRALKRARGSARPDEPGLAGPAHRRPEAFFDTFSEPIAMGFTITEKILARTAGLPSVNAGDEIMAKPDFVLAYDFPGYTDVIFKQLKNDFGITKMAEPERFGIFIDHMVPGDHARPKKSCTRARANGRAINDVKLYERKGIGHQVSSEVGYATPGAFAVHFDGHVSQLGTFGTLAMGLRRNVLEAFAMEKVSLRVPQTTAGRSASASCSRE